MELKTGIPMYDFVPKKHKKARTPVLYSLDASVRNIPLTQGQFAIVDADLFEYLMQWNWSAHWDPDNQTFYAKRTVKWGGVSKRIMMHRQLLSLAEGDVRLGDHANHDTLDNRKSNLRISSYIENAQNSKSSRLGMKGVSFDPSGRTAKPWRARIRVNGKVIRIGRFKTPEEAHAAYIEAANTHFGEFACFQ